MRVRACARLGITSGRDPGCFFIWQIGGGGVDRGVFVTSFFVLVWDQRKVKAGGRTQKVHGEDPA